jgi:hypothetical protein
MSDLIALLIESRAALFVGASRSALATVRAELGR